MVSAQNLRPAQDEEALAHAVLQGEAIYSTRKRNPREDLRDIPEGDIEEDVPIEEAAESAEEGPSYGLLDGPQPLSSIFEEDEEGETPAARGRSRSPPPMTVARSRRGSIAEPDAERTPNTQSPHQPCRVVDDLPASIRHVLKNDELRKKPT